MLRVQGIPVVLFLRLHKDPEFRVGVGAMVECPPREDSRD
jgi:hypothetical protein